MILVFAIPLLASASDDTVKLVEAEASYTMGDSDTLAAAEEQAILRAKRKAIEAAGVYIETTSQELELSSGERTKHLSRLGTRTLGAAVTETDILEKRRSVVDDRMVLYTRIRAKVHVDWLSEAVTTPRG